MSRTTFVADLGVALRRRATVVAALLTVATLALALVERTWPSDGEWIAPVQVLLRYTALAALLATGFAAIRAASRARVSWAARLGELGLAAAIAGSFLAIAAFAWPPLDRYDESASYAPPPLPWLAPTESDERDAEAARRIRRVRRDVAALDHVIARPLTVASVIDTAVGAGALPALRWSQSKKGAVMLEVQDRFAEPTLAVAVLPDPSSATAFVRQAAPAQGCGDPQRHANVVLLPLRCATEDERQLSAVAGGLERRLERLRRGRARRGRARALRRT